MEWLVTEAAGRRCSSTLLKKRLCHRCFSVNFTKLLRNLFNITPLDVCFCDHRHDQRDTERISELKTGGNWKFQSCLFTSHSNKNFEYIALYYFTGSTQRVFWSILLHFLVNNFTFSKTCKIVEEGMKGFSKQKSYDICKRLIKGQI